MGVRDPASDFNLSRPEMLEAAKVKRTGGRKTPSHSALQHPLSAPCDRRLGQTDPGSMAIFMLLCFSASPCVARVQKGRANPEGRYHTGLS